MRINSFDKDIQSVLSSNYYMIPRFQRPYSWDKENVQEFWNDTIANREDEYFIGSIVVFLTTSGSYGIVDGQQRLTTITMLLCSIRDKFKELGFSDLAMGIHNLIEKRDISNVYKYILQTETSFPYFQEYIQKYAQPEVVPEIINEEKTIQIAFKEINNLINEAISSIDSDSSVSTEEKIEQKKQKLILFRDRLLNLKVIFVELDNEDDAYLIFETLNTRGKDLSPSDLVKNLLSRYIHPSNQDVDYVKLKWNGIVKIIENAPGEVSTNNFLHHYWLSKYEYTSQKKLFKLMRRRINRDNASSYLDDFDSSSKIYRYLFEPTYKEWNNQESEIRRSLNALDLFNVRQPIPLLLSIMTKYELNNLTKKQVIKILRSIESFIFKYTAIVTTQSTGGLSMMYSNFARRITDSDSQDEKNTVLKDLKAKLKELSPSFDEFKVSFRNTIYTNTHTKERKLVRYILSKFHDDINPSHVFDYNLMTIEHILSQSLIDGETYTDYDIGCIGNLILVNQELNDKLSDKSFSDKKRILLENGFSLDSFLNGVEDWSLDAIEQRFDWMSEKAYNEYWKI